MLIHQIRNAGKSFLLIIQGAFYIFELGAPIFGQVHQFADTYRRENIFIILYVFLKKIVFIFQCSYIKTILHEQLTRF